MMKKTAAAAGCFFEFSVLECFNRLSIGEPSADFLLWIHKNMLHAGNFHQNML